MPENLWLLSRVKKAAAVDLSIITWSKFVKTNTEQNNYNEIMAREEAVKCYLTFKKTVAFSM